MSDLQSRAQTLAVAITQLVGNLQLSEKKQLSLELEDKMQATGFWDDNQTAQEISQKYKHLKEFVDFWSGLESDAQSLVSLAKEDGNPGTEKYLAEQLQTLEERYSRNRLLALLSKRFDDHNAIVSIHAGAGGTDAQDWAEILLRMYTRFADQKGFKVDLVELNKGGEAGIKSATLVLSGPFAYGYMKSEAGVHRLVRLSPFNPAHTRETSFALLEVLPELEEQEQVSIDPKDLKIENTTASGHGGQSVNTTYSAVRITHIPTGIRVSIQNERSQHQNKETALKILRGRLQALEDERLHKEKQEMRGEFKSAEWGNQIRSYVLHPYQLVKDHRTDYETADTAKVLDGELDVFIERYLEKFSSV